MNWITGIQAAINYIEDHLTEELDYDAIAKESFSSSAHLQRIFSILCVTRWGNTFATAGLPSPVRNWPPTKKK